MSIGKNSGFHLFYVLVLVVMSVSSCKKNDDVPDTVSLLTTRVNVISATPDTLNLYLNGSRVNTTSSLYPFGALGYIDLKIGAQDYQVKRYRSANILFNLPLTLDAANVYSLFVAGTKVADTFTILDTLKADTASRAMVRFVNASPGSGSLDVSIDDTLRFKSRAYQTASTFIPVSVAVGLKHLKVMQAGSTVAIADTSRTLLAGRVYTLFVKGTLAGTGGMKFGTGLVVNQ